MAKQVLVNPYFSFGGTDYTSYMQSLTINYSREEVDATFSQASAGKARLAGLYDWSMDVEMMGDLANGGVNDVIFAAVGTQTAIIAKMAGSTTGVANPKFSGNGTIFSLPQGGRVGELFTLKFTILGSDGVALARAESD